MPIRPLALTALAAAAMLPGCTSQQLYSAGRSAQRHDCQQIADYERRDRCLKDAATPQRTYEREREAAIPRPVLDGELAGWMGRWRGPEGTYLDLSPAPEGYTVTVQNLDGARQFKARVVDDHIEFERDGRVETLRATDGPATGMKWLQDKRRCLTVRAGEGYCRD